jgi:plasmid stabilization system protein ParE
LAYRVVYRRRAERNLEALAKVLGFELFEAIVDAIESLAELPERCALVPEPELRRVGIRHLLCGWGNHVYRIIYRVRDERVEILTIRHGRRRPLRRV